MADKTSESSKQSEKGATQKNAPPAVVAFNQSIDIISNQPLPEYDRKEIKAYRAIGKNKLPANLIAFMCEKHLTPRWRSAITLSKIMNPNVAYLIATGPVFWPPDGTERYAIIYELNWGKALFSSQKRQAFGIKQDILLEQFLPPIIGVLKDFHEKGFIHGGIRLDNLYGGSGHSFKTCVLGDSLTTPASYMQPSVYEPIERSMADPISRGMGHFVDDIYSLGIMLTIMLRNYDPLQDMDASKIIQEKIEKGTYAAVTGKDRFTGAILELLRGILHDDKSQRWTIDEVSHWLEGQRLSPKQQFKRKKASRVFHIEGHRYVRPEVLAYHLSEYADVLPNYIEDEKLQLWVQRSLENKEALERLDLAIVTAKDAGFNDNFKYRLASRVAIALDPPAPIRYKNINFLPEGFGAALAQAYVKRLDLAPYAEILEQGLVMFWLNAQSDKTIDYGSLATRFEQCRSMLKNRGAGFGLERCVYLLNQSIPCLSSKFSNFYIKTPDEMVLAFEKLCKNGQIEKLFLDRHCIAFLSVKDSRILDSYLIELNATEEYKNILGNVWAISNIQQRFEMGPLPNIAEHIVKIMGPVLERFHDRDLRHKMTKEFERIKKSGNISLVKVILENPEIIESDLKSFFRNMRRYKKIEAERQDLQNKIERKEGANLGHSTGRTVAAIISTVIGGIGIITLSLMELSEVGFF